MPNDLFLLYLLNIHHIYMQIGTVFVLISLCANKTKFAALSQNNSAFCRYPMQILMLILVYDWWVTRMTVTNHLQLNFTIQQISPFITLNQFYHKTKLYIILCAVNEYDIHKLICRYFNDFTLSVTRNQMSHGNWDSAIYMMTIPLAGQVGNYSLIPDRSIRCLSTSKHLYWLWTPFSLLFNWYWDLFLRVKHSGHEADHTFAYSAENANECSYTSTLPYAFMAYAGIFTCIWYIIFVSICLFPTKKKDYFHKFEIFTALWLTAIFFNGIS